jgi:hypothetical protein
MDQIEGDGKVRIGLGLGVGMGIELGGTIVEPTEGGNGGGTGEHR